MAESRLAKLEQQLAEYAKLQGFDEIPLKDRRKRARKLLDQGSKLSPQEETELVVLLLMGLGMTEHQARQDVILRARQTYHRKEYKVR